MVLFIFDIVLYKVVLTLESVWMESLSVIEIKASEQYFPVVLFVPQYFSNFPNSLTILKCRTCKAKGLTSLTTILSFLVCLHFVNTKPDKFLRPGYTMTRSGMPDI